ERDLDGLFLAIAQHDNVDRLAHGAFGDGAREIAHLADRIAIEGEDHVARLDRPVIHRAILDDAGDERTTRSVQAKAFRNFVGDRLDAHAKPAAPGFTELDQLIDNVLRKLGRNGKADADRAARR